MPPNEYRIIIPKHIPLKTPRKMIYPKVGDLVMECGNCGHREFGVYVTPGDGGKAQNGDGRKVPKGTAQVKEIVCTTCGRFYKLDPRAMLGGGDVKTLKRGSESGTITD